MTVEAKSSDAKVMTAVQDLIADAFCLRPEQFPAGTVATRELARQRVILGGQKTESLSSYPFVVVFIGDESTRINPANAAALGHADHAAAATVEFYFVNQGLSDADNRYLDAVNFVSGVIDDVWYLYQRDQVANRVARYIDLDSTRRVFGPIESEESEAATDGKLTTSFWWASYSIRVFGFEAFPERRS